MERVFEILIFCIITINTFSCGGGSQQTRCATCGGTGKIQKSSQVPLRYEVVDAKWENKGVLNPDYYLYVTIKNLGSKGGNFIVNGDFVYEDIGAHKESTEEYIEARSTKTVVVRYDADKSCDKVDYQVIAPTVVETTEEICPTCGGQGVIRK